MSLKHPRPSPATYAPKTASNLVFAVLFLLSVFLFLSHSSPAQAIGGNRGQTTFDFQQDCKFDNRNRKTQTIRVLDTSTPNATTGATTSEYDARGNAITD